MNTVPELIAQLPPELRAELDAARDQWAARSEGLRGSRRHDDERAWRAGLHVIRILDHVGENQGRTALIGAFCAYFGSGSRGQLYKAMDVARAFPEELPPHKWEVLYRLSKMPAAEREKLLESLPPDATLKDVPYPRRARQLTPEGEADKRQAEERAGRLAAAQAEVRALHPEDRVDFTLDLVLSLDISPFPPAEQGYVVEQFEQAVAGLRESLTGAADEAASRDAGNNDRSSPATDAR